MKEIRGNEGNGNGCLADVTDAGASIRYIRYIICCQQPHSRIKVHLQRNGMGRIRRLPLYITLRFTSHRESSFRNHHSAFRIRLTQFRIHPFVISTNDVWHLRDHHHLRRLKASKAVR